MTQKTRIRRNLKWSVDKGEYTIFNYSNDTDSDNYFLLVDCNLLTGEFNGYSQKINYLGKPESFMIFWHKVTKKERESGETIAPLKDSQIYALEEANSNGTIYSDDDYRLRIYPDIDEDRNPNYVQQLQALTPIKVPPKTQLIELYVAAHDWVRIEAWQDEEYVIVNDDGDRESDILEENLIKHSRQTVEK